VTFITAGDPDLTATPRMVLALEKAGADIIELGVPFSDPMADGPTIQRSSERSLAAGTTIPGLFTAVKEIRTQSQIPIVLMGYYNPVFVYGVDRFTREAAEAGVDGLLVVDLPPEESEELKDAADRAGLDLIFLLTPTSDDGRIAKVVREAKGFIYYVSVTGVTGARAQVAASVSGMVERIRRKTTIPLVVGFGVSNGKQAGEIAAYADGVVVGSAIVKLFEEHKGDGLVQAVARLAESLKEGVTKSGC
jgi:tryptophan synthase alpha chain